MLKNAYLHTAEGGAVGVELRDRTLGDWLGMQARLPQVLAALLGKLLLSINNLLGARVRALTDELDAAQAAQ